MHSRRTIALTLYSCLILTLYYLIPAFISTSQFEEETKNYEKSRPLNGVNVERRIERIFKVEKVPNERTEFNQNDRKKAETSKFELSQQFIIHLTAQCEKIRKKSPQLLLFTMVNNAYFNFTHNWLCNTANMSTVHDSTLIVSTDKETCHNLERFWPNVACIWSNFSSDFHSALSWGQKSYVNFLTLRALVLKALVSFDVPVLLFETDAIWFRNPISYFKNFSQNGDISVPLKGYPDKSLTLSFNPMLLIPTETTKTFLEKMTTDLLSDSNLFDQDLLDKLCKEQYAGIACANFPWEDISDGLWFKLAERERAKFKPYVVNNNYYVGVENKIARQALNGLWFVTLKRECNRKRINKLIEL